MNYLSTRGRKELLSFDDVLISGLAPDGGLYVPRKWPEFSHDEIAALSSLSYQEIAFRVIKPFVGDTFSDSILQEMLDSAYSTFNHSAVCPLVQIDRNHFLLELFHGPTLAFKDVAMQLIGQMFDYCLKKRNQRATIVAATSGDTGSAAMAAFKKSSLVNMFVLFPKEGVSEVQRRQMTTFVDSHLQAVALEGDFDDCQSLVKQMFKDSVFKEKVALSGVNSINWARILAQVVYYFSSAVAVGSPYRKVNFTVPTGNFGDIYAAYVAKKMGLPVGKLVIATNQNDILHRALSTGLYERKKLRKSISPSMDIQVASNFERLLYDLYNSDGCKIKAIMEKFLDNGKLHIDSDVMKVFGNHFASGAASEIGTEKTISESLEKYSELVCPHTAVGLHVADNYRIDKNQFPMITLATAHPAKFPESVKRITGIDPELPKQYNDLFSLQEHFVEKGNDLEEVKALIEMRTVK
jgi:threonine synthase